MSSDICFLSSSRPLLADIIQIENVNELCKLLVLVSRQAAGASVGIVLSKRTIIDVILYVIHCAELFYVF